MKRTAAFPFTLLFLLTANGLAQQLALTPEKAGGLYALKEPIRWRVEVTGVKPNTAIEARYEVSKDGAAKPMEVGEIRLDAGKGTVETSLSEPGAVIVNVSAKVGGKLLKKDVGAAVAPERIRPSMPRPDDFDAFWKEKIESLRAVPMNARLEQVDAEKSVDYFKVRMDNIRTRTSTVNWRNPSGRANSPPCWSCSGRASMD